MNLKNFKEFNRFKELVSSRRQIGWRDEISAFKEIKESESFPIEVCLSAGHHFVLVGIVKDEPDARPVVYNYDEGPEYPKPAYLAFFPKIDLLQNIIGMQDTIDVVSNLKEDLGMVQVPFSPENVKLFNVCTVYGKDVKRGQKLVPSLTLAEVTSQLGQQYIIKEKMLFYVCDAAEECGNLTYRAGYHAYRVAVYSITDFPEKLEPEISIDGCCIE